MTLEVELKAPAPRGVESKLHRLGAMKLTTVTNRDSYYDMPGEPLRRRGITLRLRKQGRKLMLTYKSKSKSKRTKAKEEIELRVAPAIVPLLAGLGYSKTFEKEVRRTEYRLGATTVCVDRVKGLGTWVEFEVFAPPAEARRHILSAAAKLGIPEPELTTASYPTLLREKLKKKKGGNKVCGT